MLLTSFKKSMPTSKTVLSILMVAGISACGKTSEATDKQSAKATGSTPAAPTISYEQLIVSDDSVGDIFKKRSLEFGNAIDYVSRMGVINILENVVESADSTGYVKIEKAYSFGQKYILIISTGENGASCPATTYAISFDQKTESVTGKEEIDGCSENIESLSDGNKLIVKKDGTTSTFYNGEIKGKPKTQTEETTSAAEGVSSAGPVDGKNNSANTDNSTAKRTASISGSYSGNNRFGMFEQMDNGDVRFYISGMRVGSRYPCNIGDADPAILQMNGSTGGYSDGENSISVEFLANSAKVIVGKSQCIIDGTYEKTGDKSTVNWDFESGD